MQRQRQQPQQIDLVILRTHRRHARCRWPDPKTPGRIVLRTPDVADVVPGEIARVSVRRRWTELGETHVTGAITNVRLDARALGLEPLALCTEDPEVPESELEFLLLGRRTEPLPGELPEDAEHAAVLLEVDLRCLAAHARLGDEAFEVDPERARRHYEVGLRIGELRLEHIGDGQLPSASRDNFGFLRCLRGYARCQWRLGRWKSAERELARLLALDRADALCARVDLDEIRARRTWDHHRRAA